ncbi:MAG: DEDD exonuclease domain-containing protein [Microthrixaceae bacterium]
MTRRSPRPASMQASFDDLGTPLSDVTFCVIDFETTGSNTADSSITEIGAVKLRGGECLGTLQTLVNPGRAIPPTITVLTGITEAMVVRAPRIETVLGTLVDFIGDAVIVAHNARFDMAFLQDALRRDGRPPATNTVVDTVPLARRLLRDEVPNCKLGTLARHFRFQHTPTHRALDDALATGDLLHVLLDRARALGVTGLDDLRTLPKMANHAQAAKLRLTDRLPREPGVYLFREPSGKVLYVGKATNLRSRVRSYFSTDDRRKIGPMLREMGRIDFKRTSSPLEAAVLEIRLIHHLEPHYNREGTRWRKSVYVKLSAERFPRLTVVKQARDDGGTYLGPIGSRANAALVVEAIETVVPLRRCTATKPTSRGPCIPAQLGVALCLCDRSMTPEDYAPTAALARRCLTTDPGVVIDALTDRMRDLAAEERFEEAAATPRPSHGVHRRPPTPTAPRPPAEHDAARDRGRRRQPLRVPARPAGAPLGARCRRRRDAARRHGSRPGDRSATDRPRAARGRPARRRAHRRAVADGPLARPQCRPDPGQPRRGRTVLPGAPGPRPGRVAVPAARRLAS